MRVVDKAAVREDSLIQESVKKITEELGENSRILVRESGTEPVIRVMVEAADFDTCSRCVDEVVELIISSGYAVEA